MRLELAEIGRSTQHGFWETGRSQRRLLPPLENAKKPRAIANLHTSRQSLLEVWGIKCGDENFLARLSWAALS